MAQIKGWTLVVFYITAAAVVWFLATIGPGVNGWLKDQQHLAGWAQAVGAVVAILGAFYLGKKQADAARALVREQQLVEAVRLMQSIRKLLEHTWHTVHQFREAWLEHGQFYQTTQECERLKVAIERVDIMKCNSPHLVEYLLQLPQLLTQVIQHQVYVSSNLNAVYVSGRDEPGFRHKVFTVEMRKTEEIENFIGLAIERAETEEKAINEMRHRLQE